MKKYIIFSVSFILLYALLMFSVQILTGIYLTSTYVPNIEEVWDISSILPQQIEIGAKGGSFIINLLIAFISATGAYFILRKTLKI